MMMSSVAAIHDRECAAWIGTFPRAACLVWAVVRLMHDAACACGSVCQLPALLLSGFPPSAIRALVMAVPGLLGAGDRA